MATKLRHTLIKTAAAMTIIAGITTVSAMTVSKAVPQMAYATKKQPECEKPQNINTALANQSPAKAPSRPYIHGAVIYADNWATDDDWSVTHCQMGQFRPLSTVTVTTEKENPAFDISGGAYRDGKYHAVKFTEFEGSYSVDYMMFDATTWNEEKRVHSELRGNIPVDLTCDETTGIIYGSFLATGNGYDFGRLNTTTGEKETIGHFPVNILSLAADGNGVIYAFGWATDGTTTLYTVDKTSGELSKVGETGVKTHSFLHSATFDIKNNTLYWAPIAKDEQQTLGVSTLYTVDTATGAATYVGKFRNNEEISGMFIITPLAEDGAPAAIEEIKLDYPEGNLNGNISFSAPVITYDGKRLSGKLSYSINVDGKEVLTGETSAGEEVSLPYTMTRGSHSITATTSNSIGRSPVASAEEFFGPDVPEAPLSVTAEVEEGNKVRVKWEPSTTATHGGYIDPSSVRYNVVRMPDNKKILENSAETEAVDIFNGGTLTKYHYSVSPVVDGMTSGSTESNRLVMGDAIDLPYNETFDTAESFDLFTVLSTRRPVFQWSWHKDRHAAYMMDGDGTESQKPDDWLVLPPMRLDTRHRYTLAFDYWTYSFPMQMEVRIGKSPSVEALNGIILPRTEDLLNKEYEAMDLDFSVEEEGIYYLAIHGLEGSRSGLYLYVDNIDVFGIPFGVPAAPAVNALAHENGGLGVNLDITLPTETFDGKTLENITGLEIKRNDRIIKTYSDNLTVGGNIKCTDTDFAADGMADYTVTAYSTYGKGIEQKTSLYVGLDTPARISEIRVKETVPGVVRLDWDAPSTGEHGGYVNPAELEYEVYRLDTDIEPLEEPMTHIKETGAEYRTTLGAEQELSIFAVYALNNKGYSEGTASDIVTIGTPYGLPFNESFADGKNDMSPWATDLEQTAAKWEINASASVLKPQDNDGGLLTFLPGKTNDKARYTTPKIALSGAKSPMLKFWVYNNHNLPSTLAVYISNNHGEYTKAADVVLADETIADKSWRLVEIPLDNHKDSDFIQICFEGTSGAYNTPVFLDNITVSDTYDIDLGLSALTGPKTVTAGDAATLTATVFNNGKTKSGDYTLNLYSSVSGDETIATASGQGVLPGKTQSVRLSVRSNVTWPSEVTFRCEVVMEGDENPANNTVTLSQILERPEYPVVDNLQATVADKVITLKWSSPDPDDMEDKPSTDDLESYEDFAISNNNGEMGEWSVIDIDGGEAVGAPINPATGSTFDFPNACKPQAFMLFNPLAAGLAIYDQAGNPGAWAPHSGNKYFVAFYDADGQNDDWLISPRLTGTPQAISFYAKAVSEEYKEKFEILYSTTDKQPTSFTTITRRESPDEWTEQTFAVPAGAKYFAIRCVSEDAFALMLDDFSFVSLSNAGEPLAINGYNIYRDGIRINKTIVLSTGYEDAEASDGDHVYSVTTVYNRGESDFSNEVTANPNQSGLDYIYGDLKIGSRDGMICIDGATGRHMTITDISGIVIYNGSGNSDTLTFMVSPGIYAISVGEIRVKISVK